MHLGVDNRAQRTCTHLSTVRSKLKPVTVSFTQSRNLKITVLTLAVIKISPNPLKGPNERDPDRL